MNTKIINKLKQLKPILKEKFGIEEFGVFGSVARGDDREDSDIDIAIIKAKQKDYFLRMDAKYYLEDIFHKNIDLGYFDSIRPIIKKHISKDLIYV